MGIQRMKPNTETKGRLSNMAKILFTFNYVLALCGIGFSIIFGGPFLFTVLFYDSITTAPQNGIYAYHDWVAKIDVELEYKTIDSKNGTFVLKINDFEPIEGYAVLVEKWKTTQAWDFFNNEGELLFCAGSWKKGKTYNLSAFYISFESDTVATINGVTFGFHLVKGAK